MKFAAALLTLVAAASTAYAAAAPDPEAFAVPEAEPFRRYCHLPGQGCGKLKRAADAAAEALAIAEPHPGPHAEPFRKLKRAAEDLSKAAEDAMPKS